MAYARARSSVFAAACGVLLLACSGSGDEGTSEPRAADTAPPATTATAAATAEAGPVDLSDYTRPLTSAEQSRADSLVRSFTQMDPTVRAIDLTELLAGGPGKDGIPALAGDAVKFVAAGAADAWLDEREPVIALELNGEARAYPLQILMWHEIANDVVGGVPVVVTFCPLCNTAIVFDARVDGEPREFGVSGMLRFSDLVMYDRTEESFWQQITGEAIVGVDTGKQLDFLPAQIVSWGEFKQTFPGATVLSRETGFSRAYGENPYFGYDRVGSPTFFPVPLDDPRLDAKARVLTVERDGDYVAFPFSALEEHIVLEAEVGGAAVVAFWQPGTLSALDAGVFSGSRDVGSAAAFVPVLDGDRLTFEAREGAIVDAESGSTWNVLGRATDGPHAGRALEPVVAANHLWFAWVVFRPETRVITGPS